MIFQVNNKEKDDIYKSAKALADSFIDYSYFSYLSADKNIRSKKLLTLFNIIVKDSCKAGELYKTSDNYEGISIWLRPGKYHLNTWRFIRSGGLSSFFEIGFKNLSLMSLQSAQLYDIQKKYEYQNFWYLYCLGVQKKFRGKGFASGLIKPKLDKIDKEQSVSYLETASRDNIEMYQHYGFNICGSFADKITGSTVWSMIREPQ